MSADIPSFADDQLRLPEIPLSDLPEGTKAYLMTRATSSGKPLNEVMRDIWNDEATSAEHCLMGSSG